MNLWQYLPSRQFAIVAASLFFAGFLVAAADYWVSPKPSAGSLAVSESAQPNADWQHMLEDVQGGAAFASLPTPISDGEVDEMLKSAQSDNLTSNAARSILIKLTAAKAEGLGGDIPTQESIVEDALSRIETPGPELYVQADLSIAPSSQEALHAYGNAVIESLGTHAQANSENALRAFATVVDSGSKTELETLADIGAQYSALARDLAELPTPKTIAPLHLQASNNLLKIAQTFSDMRAVLDDPLRGLSGFQRYRSLMGEEARLLTNIAEGLRAGGIIFSKEEPGAAWEIFINS